MTPGFSNVRLEILSVAKDELLEDFADAPELSHSGLFAWCTGEPTARSVRSPTGCCARPSSSGRGWTT
jgi:predicted component of type VI protein secretion system